ncbi:hypothetical protein ABZY34_20375 [Streptomyces virginiae]|uniref:hypothetical protein n=1 Tax=Streptomyces virginiae TaxID=1961 RepID=UPI0033AB2EAD
MPAARSAPSRVPASAWRTVALVWATVVRVRLRTASIAQKPWGSDSTPATVRTAASARLIRTASWKYTERGPACAANRCHHRRGASRPAYQNRPESVPAGGGGARLPRTASSAAVAKAAAASATSSSAARRRPRTSVTGCGSRSAASLNSSRSRRRAPASSVARPVPASRAPVSAADRPTASSSSSPVFSGDCPAGGGGRFTSRPSSVRAPRPVWARARSRRPGPAGRSASSTWRGRSDSPIFRALSTSAAGSVYGARPSSAAKRAAASAAPAASSR